MEFGQPVVGRGLQKAPHLAPRVDEVAAAPLALTHIHMRVFVKRGAVVAREAVAVHREMHGHKVQDRADARLMQEVDQCLELIGRAVARGRGEKARVLIAPRAVERMLGQGQKLDMREPVFGQVGDEQVSQLIVAVPAVFVRRAAPPRARMQLIDIQRRVGRGRARLHPVLVRKRITLRGGEDRAAARPQLHRAAVGVAVFGDRAVPAVDAVFVELARRRARAAALPKAAAAVLRQVGFIPAVARAGDRDARGVGRKGAENSGIPLEVRAEPAVGIEHLPVEKCLLECLSVHGALPLCRYLGYNRYSSIIPESAHRHNEQKNAMCLK